MKCCTFCGKWEVENLIADDNDEPEEDRVITTLTEERAQIFEENEMCLMACKQVVMEAISHWEKAMIAQKHLWRKVYASYCQDLSPEEKNRLRFCPDTRILKLLTKGNALRNGDVISIIDDKWMKVAKGEMESE